MTTKTSGPLRAGLRRRGALSSRPVRIAVPWSWPARILFVLVLAAGSGAVAMWALEQSRTFAGVSLEDIRAQLAEREDELEALREERDRLSAVVNAAESELNIERAAQRQLAGQVSALEAENARLKEDLAFFDSLLPNTAAPRGVAIRRLKIDQVAPNQLRYRLLIMQGGKNEPFNGKVELAVSMVQDGKSAMMIYPEEGTDDARFRLEFRHYQRLEGVLTLPDGVAVTAVSARVVEKGQVRAQTSVNL